MGILMTNMPVTKRFDKESLVSFSLRIYRNQRNPHPPKTPRSRFPDRHSSSSDTGFQNSEPKVKN